MAMTLLKCPAMSARKEKWIAGVVIAIFMIVITVPYIYANVSTDGSLVFGGFLINPIDGNSYLAKMRQGYEGNWLFTLPYTADPGKGAALNLYYLFLGHLSRLFGGSLIFIFHMARILGALLLSLVLYQFIRRIFAEPDTRLLAFGLILFGSGLGWIATAFGLFTSDFWVSEAYPFLASFANAHFPIGLAIQVWLLTPFVKNDAFTRWRALTTLVGAAILSVVYPFGWVVVAAVSMVWVAWLTLNGQSSRQEIRRLAWVIVGGSPYLLHSLWAINSHPVLAQWNAQNQTPAPNFVDFILSFSPAILFAIWGTILYLQNSMKNKSHLVGFIVLWMLVGILIVFVPLNLQRRLMSGLYIPIAVLAVYTLQQMFSASIKRLLLPVLVILSLPTNLLVLMGTVNAARTHDASIYVYRDELNAFSWLDENVPLHSLIMASPDSGLLIPAYTSERVLYGHPFETVDAALMFEEVSSFYSGKMDDAEAEHVIATAGVHYVFYGPREKILGPLPSLDQWRIVFDQGQIQIWAPGG